MSETLVADEPTILDPNTLPPLTEEQKTEAQMSAFLSGIPAEAYKAAATAAGDDGLRAATLREVTTGKGPEFTRKGRVFWAESPSLDVVDDLFDAMQTLAGAETKPGKSLRAAASLLYYTRDTELVAVPAMTAVGILTEGTERRATVEEIGRHFGLADAQLIKDDLAFYLGLGVQDTDQGEA
jgi:hypothetical protein